MKQVKLMNKIAKVGTDCLSGGKYVLGEAFENPDAIMVRSAKLHDMPLNDNLRAIARAGAGVNNIPVENARRQASLFSTPLALMLTA